MKARQAKPLLSPPDLLTAARIPLAIAFLVVPGSGARLGVVVAAALSDMFDGVWARRLGGSRLGIVLDPVCDKVFMMAAFWVVFRSGVLAPLELLGVLVRDLMAIVGFLGSWMLRKPTTLPARAGGKAVTVAQLLTLIAFLAGSELSRPLAWATAAISLYAITDYSRVAWSR